jgi:hypothetical protein
MGQDKQDEAETKQVAGPARVRESKVEAPMRAGIAPANVEIGGAALLALSR